MTTVGTANTSNRELWLKKTLQEIPAGLRVLDAGAGEQRYRQYCTHLNYVSLDFGEYDGNGDGTGLQTGVWDQSNLDIICDITSIPEPDGAFDAIMCIEVFEHLPDPLAALNEFARLIRSGGQLILTAPFCSLTHFAPYHYYTGFNKYFYEAHLPARGFQVEELVENGNYFEYLAQEVRRIPSVAAQYANTRPTMFDLLILRFVLSMLDRFIRRDKGSSELLHYGYLINAIKI